MTSSPASIDQQQQPPNSERPPSHETIPPTSTPAILPPPIPSPVPNPSPSNKWTLMVQPQNESTVVMRVIVRFPAEKQLPSLDELKEAILRKFYPKEKERENIEGVKLYVRKPGKPVLISIPDDEDVEMIEIDSDDPVIVEFQTK